MPIYELHGHQSAIQTSKTTRDALLTYSMQTVPSPRKVTKKRRDDQTIEKVPSTAIPSE
jgi:hypothetical protein